MKRYSRARSLVVGIILAVLGGCSTVKVNPQNEFGQVSADFKKIKVMSHKYHSFVYQVQLEDLESLYASDDLRFAFTLFMKPTKGGGPALSLPFVEALRVTGGENLKVLKEEEVKPNVYRVTFAYTLNKLKAKIEAQSNLILEVNRADMYLVISIDQMEGLYKELVKRGYVLDIE